jgi:hypothetical protein
MSSIPDEEVRCMKTLLALLATVLFAGSSVAYALNQETALRDTLAGCDTESPESEALLEEEEGVVSLNATIRKIDYQKGLLDLDTEVGLFQISVSPLEIQDLKVGDEILVYVIEEDEASSLTPVAL